jgi:segregation and condensation protein A
MTVTTHSSTTLIDFSGDRDLYNVKLDDFEGPLDLLLHLIKKNEVDIYNIPIATITRQYLTFLDLMKELNLDVAGEFLVMASTLVQIKSRMLLPVPADEDGTEEEQEDPRAELVRRLLEYQKYKEAALTLESRELLGRDTFARKFQPQELQQIESEPVAVEIEMFELIEAFQRLLARVPVATFHQVGADSISITERITALLALLEGKEAMSFEALFEDGPGTREFLIVTFLAILELCKLKVVKLVQAQSYGTIWIMPMLLAAEAGDITEEGSDHHEP